MDGTTRKVGRITVACGLVALGAALLMDNLLAADPDFTGLALRLWPAVLIGFGVEYLVFSLADRSAEGQPGRLHFDWGGAILLFLVVGLTAGFHSLSNWLSFEPGNFALVTGGRGGSETASIPIGEARQVEVEIDRGRVDLFPAQGREVRVEAAYDQRGFILRERKSLTDAFDLTAEAAGEVVRIRGKAPDGFTLGHLSASYRIYVPAGMPVRLRTGAGSISVRAYDGEVHLSTNVGSISVSEGTGQLHLESRSGSIRVLGFNGPVSARTDAGLIDITRVTGALQLESGTGSIRVDEWSGGQVVAETRMGSIHAVTRTPLEGNVLLRTQTGSINLALPAGSNMQVTAETRTGSITAPPFVAVTRQGTSQTGVGTNGTGEHLVTLKTEMGSIHLDLMGR